MKEKRELLLNQIVNLLTNIPSSCFGELLESIEETNNQIDSQYEFENMNMEAIYILVQFLKNRLEQVIFKF